MVSISEQSRINKSMKTPINSVVCENLGRRFGFQGVSEEKDNKTSWSRSIWQRPFWEYGPGEEQSSRCGGG